MKNTSLTIAGTLHEANAQLQPLKRRKFQNIVILLLSILSSKRPHLDLALNYPRAFYEKICVFLDSHRYFGRLKVSIQESTNNT
jgi:hypothetical protein